MNPEKSPLYILKKYWGYDSFRFKQEEIIQSVLAGNDTLALMPTSGGKSICYQVPALCKSGLTLVVSPLISLMQDQVKKLQDMGIAVRAIYSPMSHKEMEVVINNCFNHRVKLLYVSPERATSSYFLANCRDLPINLIAIDEAHCISKWGYDFRPSYLKLHKLKDLLPQVPILALTATATLADCTIIQEALHFKKENIIQTSFKRDNLIYTIRKEEEKYPSLKRILSSHSGSGIIYVRTRLHATTLAKALESDGFAAKAYHAGMKMFERQSVQSSWQENITRIIVATTAFGMGIDKKDVNFVIHYDLPESLDAYMQEVGRCGRGGQKAYGILIYNEQDKYALMQNIKRNFPDEKYILNVYNALGNNYNIACGTGEGRKFPFEITSFAQRYGFDIYSLANSLRLLENSGLINLLPEGNPLSKVFLYTAEEELYNFLLQYPVYTPIIEGLRRYYAGVHIDFTVINENFIAKKYHLPNEDVSKSLQMLEKLNVLFYNPKSRNSMIEFSLPREQESEFILSKENYYDLKNNTIKKAQDVLSFLHSSQCREQYLLKYFGQNSLPCNQCDNCIKKNQKTSLKKNKRAIEQSIKENILSRLQLSPAKIDFFTSDKSQEEQELIIQIIRQLIDDKQISYNTDNTLFLPLS